MKAYHGEPGFEMNESGQDNVTVLTEQEAKAFLNNRGIPVVDEIFVPNISGAAGAAGKIGFPVVVKGLGRNLLHKTEKEIVFVNLNDRRAVLKAAARIAENAGDQLEGFLVQAHVTGNRELVAGMFRDEQYGNVLMFGLGGILTEVLSDVIFCLAPVSKGDAGVMMEEIRSAPILDAFRGERGVNREVLAGILVNLSEMVQENPDIAEIDINPFIVTPQGSPIAVDALILKKPAGKQKQYPPPVDPGRVGSLFHPRSVAFVGASAQFGKWGFMLASNALAGGFKGDIHLVNSKGGEIWGRPVYRSIREIPGKVDMIVVSIPAEKVIDLIPAMKEKNILNMLLISSGFGETGEAGIQLEKRLVEKAREEGIYVIGPNTMGISNPHINLYCTGSHVRPGAGSVGVVAQSGNIGVQLLAFAEQQGIGIRCFCGSGNEAMITMEDYLEALGADALTGTVMLYVESIKNGRRFYESARQVSRRKPIVLLKGGQSEAGNRAAASHTGAMASNVKVFNAACRQAGIVKVEKPMELLDLSAAFSSVPLPRGNRIAIMTMGGGWGVITSDLCAYHQFEVPPLSRELAGRFDKILPTYWSRANPVDIVGENDPGIPMSIIEEFMKWDGCDAVINLGIMGRRPVLSQQLDALRKVDPQISQSLLDDIMNMLIAFEERYMRHIVSLMDEYKKPIIGVNLVKGRADKTVYDIDGFESKALFFATPEQAVQSLARMYAYHRFLEREKSFS